MSRNARRVLIVGGTSGMGFAAASAIAGAGDTVGIFGRDASRAQVRAEELTARTGTRVLGFGADAKEPASFAAAIAAAATALGGLDGLAITAGPMQRQAEFLDLADEDWTECFEIQLMTVVRACRAALPLLIENRGALVTVAAYSMHAQKPILPHYSAMKSAVASLTKNIAKTYGPHGVRANCIAPGAIATEALDPARDAALAKYGPPEDAALNRFMIENWGMKTALNRVGKPQEVGELIAFLLSDKAAYLTGALINIDGGTDF
jgi:NAD(P)-dependent dehydrogenase (short-subunit alcohol dehydrogenase family)